MCNFSCERWAQAIFQNYLYMLLQFTKLRCFTQKKFIPIKPLSKSTTLPQMIIQCGLFENLNIIIRCCHVQVSSPFPWLLKPYVVDYFWHVAHGHVRKFFQSEFLENEIYVCYIMFQIRFTASTTCHPNRMGWKMCERDGKHTCFINLPHCLTWKCQKLSQFSNFWNLASSIALNKYHQHWMVAYKAFASSNDVSFLYSWHNALCFFTSLAWFVTLCVYPLIESNENNRFVPYQSSIHLHPHYHKQFILHSNWLGEYQPWNLWYLYYEHHFLPSWYLI